MGLGASVMQKRAWQREVVVHRDLCLRAVISRYWLLLVVLVTLDVD